MVGDKPSDDVTHLVRRCVAEVEARGLECVGIYRLCGSARRKHQLRDEIERDARDFDVSTQNVPDVNVVTGECDVTLQRRFSVHILFRVPQILSSHASIIRPEFDQGCCIQ